MREPLGPHEVIAHGGFRDASHALARVVHASAAGRVQGRDFAEHFALVHARAGGSKGAALDVAIAEQPELYRRYREQNGGPLPTLAEAAPSSFDAAILAQCRAGKTASQALDEVVTRHPRLYAQYRQEGGQSTVLDTAAAVDRERRAIARAKPAATRAGAAPSISQDED